MQDIPLRERIIFALDVPDAAQALAWVDKLEEYVGFYKVGLQLFLAGGWHVVDSILGRGHRVMLDLKFFDIPETVRFAVAQVRDRGVTFATVHGNDAIIEAAVKEKGGLQILAVTVLTSFDESDLSAMGLSGTVRELVLRRAARAIETGCDGVVASPLEVADMRTEIGGNFRIVTPGIRSAHAAGSDDQKRIASARDAILNGADHLVIGRPISRAHDPLNAAVKLQDEIRQALLVVEAGS